MMCRWKELIQILPPSVRTEADRLGKTEAREIRLRLGHPVQMNLGGRRCTLNKIVTREDIDYVITAASRYSPWAAETTARGYLTAPGGHRIGICGEAAVHGGDMKTIRFPNSLCIRVARDIPGIAPNTDGSVLIIGPPGWGKSTLLRDLARLRSETENLVVIDDRGELFPEGISRGNGLDVLAFCSKEQGIPMALRTMGPETIAVDEITEASDCRSLLSAANCGVKLLATVHGRSMADVMGRSDCRELLEKGIFDTVLRLNRDQTWSRERMGA